MSCGNLPFQLKWLNFNNLFAPAWFQEILSRNTDGQYSDHMKNFAEIPYGHYSDHNFFWT